MHDDRGIDQELDPPGPCPCGSALPRALCCLARETLTSEGLSLAVGPSEESETAALRWELATTTVGALALALPDVPVPLLGNRTPRALFGGGSEERSAAAEYLEAVTRTARALDVAFPAGQLVESMAMPAGPFSPEKRRQVVVAAVALQMLARGFDAGHVLGAHRLLRDAVRTMDPPLRKPLAFAAAVDYAVCWMHFRPEGREEVAGLYHVSAGTVARNFLDLKHALKLVWYDPRYAVQEPAWQEMLEQTARALADGEAEPVAEGEA